MLIQDGINAFFAEDILNKGQRDQKIHTTKGCTKKTYTEVRGDNVGTLVIIFAILFSVQCINVAIRKAKNAVLEKQDRQIRLLEEIKEKVNSDVDR